MKQSGEIKLFVGILLVALVLVGIAVYPMVINPPPAPVAEPPHAPDPKIDRAFLSPSWSHVRGNPNGQFILVEFGDYQCPSCGRAAPTVHDLLAKHKDKLRFVFHQYQASPEHENAPTLAMAAEAAAEQGKFWEMHDAIFKAQTMLSDPNMQAVIDRLIAIAGDLKLDPIKFRRALTSESVRKTIARDSEVGGQAKVKATPLYIFITDSGKVTQLSTTDQMKDWLAKPDNWK